MRLLGDDEDSVITTTPDLPGRLFRENPYYQPVDFNVKYGHSKAPIRSELLP